MTPKIDRNPTSFAAPCRRFERQATISPACRRACAWTPRTIGLLVISPAEYAGHFDFFLPRLAASGLPLPLGGSSNHFRTETLREVGGWDPYNVTEDADLGMRLARFGYRCGVIDSTTYEEAPADIRRGWRSALAGSKAGCRHGSCICGIRVQLFQDLGFRGFVTFQAIVGGNALVALAHPAFLVGAFWELGDADFSRQIHQRPCPFSTYYCHNCCIWLFCIGGIWLVRAAIPQCAEQKIWILAWTPFHWVLLSAAAYWAAAELILSPFRWRKTEHGLDKPTWLENTIRPLLILERYLTELKEKWRAAADLERPYR